MYLLLNVAVVLFISHILCKTQIRALNRHLCLVTRLVRISWEAREDNEAGGWSHVNIVYGPGDNITRTRVRTLAGMSGVIKQTQ